ncbi:twin-arginine translocase subunit TatC [Sporolactobacillus sp. CQH2019]|uniref:twin-arginine translocase subunit TatC n=1 Tax=Sporolactobacillus sp. CQH2019 TaxID=3023512 RepID=UPI0023689F62|nr:twin-arginine translocase subunit TatC [Sporolactobacillus sp. CQH2019]MDD9148117.1 twin-arginine translocase subunit TatC [Sporolactobacillus sp. CQH2019]
MTLLEHLNDLRKRFIVVLVTFVLSFAGTLVFVRPLYRWLVNDLSIRGKLTVLGPTDIIWVYFMLAGVVAIGVTIPIAAWQLWVFVAPALTEKERKIALAYIPSIFLLFFCGVFFGYFVVFPNILHFLVAMNAGMFTVMFTTEKYFGFLLNIVLPFGFLFELPVVVVFLTNLGILTPARMRKMRKAAYLILVILATMISPPDFVSHSLVAVPLLLLYEISVTFSSVAFRRKQRRMRAAEKELSTL